MLWRSQDLPSKTHFFHKIHQNKTFSYKIRTKIVFFYNFCVFSCKIELIHV